MGSLIARWFGHLLRREQPAAAAYWWVTELPDHQQKLYRRFYGDPENRIRHMQKIAHSIDAFEARMDAQGGRLGSVRCLTCFDTGHVCENHPTRPWDHKLPNGCECGAGMPCERCCSPVARAGSVIEAFTPDWKRRANG